MKARVLLAVMLLALALTRAGADQNWSRVRAYQCRRAAAPPVVDGRLDDPCWQQAEVAGGFVAKGAPRDQPASPATSVRFCYDDQALYAAFECQEPNLGAVTAERRARDFDVYTEDMVGLLLDVGHRRPGHYDLELALSAAGTQYDFGWGLEEGWQGEWTAATSRDPAAGVWRAELRIPYRDTREPARRGDIWGVQAMRWRYAGGREEALLWSAVPADLGAEMWSAPVFGHLLFETGDRLVAAYVESAARRLQAKRGTALALVKGNPEAGAALAALYQRLGTLHEQAGRGLALSGDEWADCFVEADRLERDYDDLVWPLRIRKLLED